MSAAPTIRQDTASYRQGIILGLTMAETMLLLIFCLLMAAALVFTRTANQLKEEQANNRTLKEANERTLIELSEAKDKVDLLLQGGLTGETATDDWKRLVVDSAPAIRKLQSEGVSLQEAGNSAKIIAEVLAQQKSSKVKSSETAGALALWAKIKADFAEAPSKMPKAEDIPKLIALGVETRARGGKVLTPAEDAAVVLLNSHGVTIKDAGETAAAIAEVVKWRKAGMSSEDLAAAIAMGEAVRKAFPPGAAPRVDQILALLREGLQAQTGTLNTTSSSGHNWPPIITLSEANGHYFDTGSAVPSPKFRSALSGSVIGELLNTIRNYPDVNVIEVIGHTDEQPILRKTSNLDQTLKSVLQQKTPVNKLLPADNAGLGLARAVSVAKVLQDDPRLLAFSILPYSGAQLVDVNDTVSITGRSANVMERRRIEIRLRKSDKIVILPPEAHVPSFPNVPGLRVFPTTEFSTPEAQTEPQAQLQPSSSLKPRRGLFERIFGNSRSSR